MKRITIERYPNPDEVQSAGLIEGEDDTGNRWIIFMDQAGRPSVYWPQREPDGAVIGDPVGMTGSLERCRQIMESAASCDFGNKTLDDLQVVRRNDSMTFDVSARVGDETRTYEVEQDWHIRPSD